MLFKHLTFSQRKIELVGGDVAIYVEDDIRWRSILLRSAAPYSFGVFAQPRNIRIPFRLNLRLCLVFSEGADSGFRGCGGRWWCLRQRSRGVGRGRSGTGFVRCGGVVTRISGSVRGVTRTSWVGRRAGTVGTGRRRRRNGRAGRSGGGFRTGRLPQRVARNQ